MAAKGIAFLIFILPIIGYSETQQGTHGTSQSSYAGQETRAIKSFSDKDLEEISRGGGWGLARAAELNGVPGPRHLLELADQIGLTELQRGKIEAIRAQMQADAIVAGEGFIAAEQALDMAFQQGAPDVDKLKGLVEGAGDARATLRLIHLNAHLLTLPLLTEEQIAHYSALRGYSHDPCLAVPDRHDADMWRRHNVCE